MSVLQGFSLTPQEQLILQILTDHPASLSGIAEEFISHGTELSVPQLMETVISLCARGLIRQEGGYYHTSAFC